MKKATFKGYAGSTLILVTEDIYFPWKPILQICITYRACAFIYILFQQMCKVVIIIPSGGKKLNFNGIKRLSQFIEPLNFRPGIQISF